MREFKYIPPEGKEFDRWDKGTPGTTIKITKNIIIRPIWKDRTPAPSEPDDPAEPDTPATPDDPSVPDDTADPTQQEGALPTVNESAPAVPANTEKIENIDPAQKSTKFVKLTVGKKRVTISWKKQSKGINGYEIQYCTDKNFQKDVKSVNISKAKNTSKTIKKLKAGRKYYFRIRTFKKKGADKIYSKWSKTKNIKVK
ncbi:fibronectin type III domain-containing protein [Butyrivibrio sp. VCD2006]|uniref:fibronectin type III domain-containing protein n=1 Tax=Butyrivibrio sp. VCD2006 TaxID=1280664 RepID=UPI0004270622|nr:fibronectin type III domain-containing protein [Butyrivibrio sp. VCD2006]